MIKVPDDQKFTPSKYLQPIPINTRFTNEELISKVVTLSGWGNTNGLDGKPITIPQYALLKGDQEIVPTTASTLTGHVLSKERHLQGSQITSTGNCAGDSGGKKILV